MKKQELLGEVRTDAGTTSSSSVTSQALRPPMMPRSPATPWTAAVPVLHVHAPSRFEGERSSSPELALLHDGIAQLAIDLNRTPGDAEATSGRTAGQLPCLLASSSRKCSP
jgi:hypothetical protein